MKKKSQTTKVASYPWYPRDALTDTALLTLEQEGAYCQVRPERVNDAERPFLAHGAPPGGGCFGESSGRRWPDARVGR